MMFKEAWQLKRKALLLLCDQKYRVKVKYKIIGVNHLIKPKEVTNKNQSKSTSNEFTENSLVEISCSSLR